MLFQALCRLCLQRRMRFPYSSANACQTPRGPIARSRCRFRMSMPRPHAWTCMRRRYTQLATDPEAWLSPFGTLSPALYLLNIPAQWRPPPTTLLGRCTTWCKRSCGQHARRRGDRTTRRPMSRCACRHARSLRGGVSGAGAVEWLSALPAHACVCVCGASGVRMPPGWLAAGRIHPLDQGPRFPTGRSQPLLPAGEMGGGEGAGAQYGPDGGCACRPIYTWGHTQ